MWIVYVIEHDVIKEFYFGITDDLRRRLSEHNRGNNKSTRRKGGKWVLIYAEAYRDKRDAVTREKRLKQHGSSKHELMKRLSHSKF